MPKLGRLCAKFIERKYFAIEWRSKKLLVNDVSLALHYISKAASKQASKYIYN